MPVFIRIVDIDDRSLGKRNSNSFTAIVPFVIFLCDYADFNTHKNPFILCLYTALFLLYG